MESRPPQESPRRPASGRKPNGSGGSPTPPWLWLLLIAGFGLIFWQFAPKNEVAVSYSPWFLDQVDEGNIKGLSIQSLEVRGELRKPVTYQPSSATAQQKVTRFITYFPSEQSIDPVLKILRDKEKLKPNEEPVRIEPSPPQAANTFVWITLLLPTFVIVGLIYFMMRRARDQFDGGI